MEETSKIRVEQTMCWDGATTQILKDAFAHKPVKVTDTGDSYILGILKDISPMGIVLKEEDGYACFVPTWDVRFIEIYDEEDDDNDEKDDDNGKILH